MQYINITPQLQTFLGTKKILKIFENFKKIEDFSCAEREIFFQKYCYFVILLNKNHQNLFDY